MQSTCSLDTITEAEFESLMSVVPCNKFISARDRAMFSLMFYGGLKEYQVWGLKYNDFTRVDGKITHVLVSGNHERKMELSEKTRNEIKLYEELYGRYCDNLPFHLRNTYFVNMYGAPISEPSSIKRKLRSWAKKSGVKATTTILRNSYSVRQITEQLTPSRI